MQIERRETETVNPLILINKDTQLPMYIVEQAIIY